MAESREILFFPAGIWGYGPGICSGDMRRGYGPRICTEDMGGGYGAVICTGDMEQGYGRGIWNCANYEFLLR
jgi:hypothetical protein